QKHKEMPAKYIKAFIATAQYYYTTKQYSKVVELTSLVPENLRDETLNLNFARSLYMLSQYNEAIVHFNKYRLSNNDLYIVCRCYILINDIGKAKEILSSNYYNTDFINLVKNDKIIKPIYNEIEKQRQIEAPQPSPEQNKDAITPNENTHVPSTVQ
ncbi:MAG TPA: hypothetical protein PLH80_09080, partial [Spirochaetota bacterium]|nr:hypothetical protein [Spirochaetota bacterium]